MPFWRLPRRWPPKRGRPGTASTTSTPPLLPAQKEELVADDLYTRYMTAYKDSTQHTAGCQACRNGRDCPAGARIHERFARLQDAYLRGRKGR